MPKPYDPSLWKNAFLHMLLLGMLFFVGYPLTNHWAALRGGVLLQSSWDQYIPFYGWMLFPYLSINLLYPCSFFLHTRKADLQRFSLQLLVAQFSSYAIFVLYPTRNQRPPAEAEGIFKLLLDQLKQFDQPFNMLPSLHIAVLVVLWNHPLRQRLAKPYQWLWHGWAGLIVISTLGTWQHYLYDVITGLILGWACILLLPYPGRSTADQA